MKQESASSTHCLDILLVTNSPCCKWFPVMAIPEMLGKGMEAIGSRLGLALMNQNFGVYGWVPLGQAQACSPGPK